MIKRFIIALARKRERNVMAKDVFISHKSEEFDSANMVRLVLERNGITCWMAPADIPSVFRR